MDVVINYKKDRFTVKRLLGALLAIVVLVVSQAAAWGSAGPYLYKKKYAAVIRFSIPDARLH